MNPTPSESGKAHGSGSAIGRILGLLARHPGRVIQFLLILLAAIVILQNVGEPMLMSQNVKLAFGIAAGESAAGSASTLVIFRIGEIRSVTVRFPPRMNSNWET